MRLQFYPLRRRGAAIYAERDGGYGRNQRGCACACGVLPILGWKNSFFGDLHALGKDGVNFYTETKVVTCRWPE